MKNNKVLVTLSAIVFTILLLIPFLLFLGWYILFYGGTLVLIAVFKVGLSGLALATLFFWVGIITAGISDMRK